MRVTLLPSSQPEPGQAPVQFLTSYLLNDTVALDGGSIGLWRTPQEQASVRHLFLTHSHLDHLASLPFFLDNVYQAGTEPVTLYGSETVLECLARDVFNDRLWPDFIRLSRERSPFLRLRRLRPGRPVEVEGLRLTPIPVDHAVPTLGFLIEEGGVGVAIPSDTGPTERFWRRANRLPNLEAVFLEATFPDALVELADVAKHLTPALFAREVGKLQRPAEIIAVHIHARYQAQVIQELKALGLPNLHIGQAGAPYEF